MKHYEYTPEKGVCTRMISFDIDENNLIHNVGFLGGCPGNLLAISKLVEGMGANAVANLLIGNRCGNKSSSCADQLSKCLLKALQENGVC